MHEEVILHVVVPFLPPTSNHCYFTNRFGGRTKTKEADAFQKRLVQEVTGPHLASLAQLNTTYKDSVFRVHYKLYFPFEEIFNRSWGKKSGAESRYKKMDAENRLKLLTDSFAKAIGIDDSRFWRTVIDKMLSPDNQERIDIELAAVPLPLFGAPA